MCFPELEVATASTSRESNSGVIVGCTAGAVLVLLLVACCCFIVALVREGKLGLCVLFHHCIYNVVNSFSPKK